MAIVGGRIAGSSLAARLAAAGLSVAVFDRDGPLRPTLSTHILHSTADIRLEGLYDGLVSAGVPPLTAVQVRIDDVQVDLRHADDPGMCPPRDILDRLLVDRAIAAGAQVFVGTPVRDLIHAGPAGDGAAAGAGRRGRDPGRNGRSPGLGPTWSLARMVETPRWPAGSARESIWSVAVSGRCCGGTSAASRLPRCCTGTAWVSTSSPSCPPVRRDFC